MKRLRLVGLVIVVAVLGALVSTAGVQLPIPLPLPAPLPLPIALPLVTNPPTPTPRPLPTPTALFDPAAEVLAAENIIRTSAGVPILVRDVSLETSARNYAIQLAYCHCYPTHVGPDGSLFWQRDERAGYVGWTALGESLDAGAPTSARVVASWMGSVHHRDAILDPNFRDTGVGFTMVDQSISVYVYYWIQEFGRRPVVVPLHS